ncbi:hypothetical protein ACFFX0_30535 [Citricoccus parietis]|uniref:Uncharacterized protein n=1 Tax=Citricoccus parietis TaxID=592307 RepID=A0ABV5G8Q6_9MICC
MSFISRAISMSPYRTVSRSMRSKPYRCSTSTAVSMAEVVMIFPPGLSG